MSEIDEVTSVQVRRYYQRTLSPGEAVFEAGDPGDQLYVIQSGEVELVRETESKQRVVAHLGPGDFFGELAVLAGVPRTATITADTDMTVEALNRREFSTLLDESPRLAKKILIGAVKRLHELDQKSVH